MQNSFEVDGKWIAMYILATFTNKDIHTDIETRIEKHNLANVVCAQAWSHIASHCQTTSKYLKVVSTFHQLQKNVHYILY